jgi:tape measure domain-containing protein
MVRIASVDIGTKLDLSGFYQGLGSLSGVKTPVVKLGVSFDNANIAQERQRLQKALSQDLIVKVKVDDVPLTQLNKHIESKRTHVKDVNAWLEKNPLRIRTTTDPINEASFKKQIVGLSEQLETKVKVKAEIKQSEGEKISVTLKDGIEKSFDTASDKISNVVKNITNSQQKSSNRVGSTSFLTPTVSRSPVTPGLSQHIPQGTATLPSPGNTSGTATLPSYTSTPGTTTTTSATKSDSSGVQSTASKIRTKNRGIFDNIFVGASENFGRMITSKFSEGLTDSIESALSSKIGSLDLVGRSIFERIVPGIREAITKAPVVRAIQKGYSESSLAKTIDESIDRVQSIIGKDQIEIEKRLLSGRKRVTKTGRNEAAAKELGIEYEESLSREGLNEVQRKQSEDELAGLEVYRSQLERNLADYMGKSVTERGEEYFKNAIQTQKAGLIEIQKQKALTAKKIAAFEEKEVTEGLNETERNQKLFAIEDLKSLGKREDASKYVLSENQAKLTQFRGSTDAEKEGMLGANLEAKTKQLGEVEKQIEAVRERVEKLGGEKQKLEHLLDLVGVKGAKGLEGARILRTLAISEKKEAVGKQREDLNTKLTKAEKVLEASNKKVLKYQEALKNALSDSDDDTILAAKALIEKEVLNRKELENLITNVKADLERLNKQELAFIQRAEASVPLAEATVVKNSGGRNNIAEIQKTISTGNVKNIGTEYKKLFAKLRTLDFSSKEEMASALKLMEAMNAQVTVYEKQADDAIKALERGGKTSGTTKKVKKQPKQYQDVIDEVAAIAGISISPEQIPTLKAFSDEEIEDYKKKGIKATGFYSSENNVLKVQKDVLAQLIKGNATPENLETLIHELTHGMQSDFGKIDLFQELKSARKLLKPTVEDYELDPKLARRVEGSASNFKGDTEREAFSREIEQDAYVFTNRNREKIISNIQRKTSLRNIGQLAGSGGGKLLNDLGKIQVEQYKQLIENNKNATYDTSGTGKLLEAKFDNLYKIFEPYLERLKNIDILPQDELDKLYKDLQVLIEKTTFSASQFANKVHTELLGGSREDLLKQLTGSYTSKDELKNIAKSHGVGSSGTKEQIAARLVNNVDLKKLRSTIPQLTPHQKSIISKTDQLVTTPDALKPHLQGRITAARGALNAIKQEEIPQISFEEIQDDYQTIQELLSRDLEDSVKKYLKGASLQLSGIIKNIEGFVLGDIGTDSLELPEIKIPEIESPIVEQIPEIKVPEIHQQVIKETPINPKLSKDLSFVPDKIAESIEQGTKVVVDDYAKQIDDYDWDSLLAQEAANIDLEDITPDVQTGDIDDWDAKFAQSYGLENLGTGLSQGIEKSIPSAELASIELAQGVTKSAKKELEIQSPSKVFERLGRFVVEGFNKGINAVNTVPSFTEKMVETGKQKVEGIVGNLENRRSISQSNKANANAAAAMSHVYNASANRTTSDIDKAMASFDEHEKQQFEAAQKYLEERQVEYQQLLAKAEASIQSGDELELSQHELESLKVYLENAKLLDKQELKGNVVNTSPLISPEKVQQVTQNAGNKFTNSVGVALADLFGGIAARVRKQTEILKMHTPSLIANLVVSANEAELRGDKEESDRLLVYKDKLVANNNRALELTRKTTITPEETQELQELNIATQDIFKSLNVAVPQVNTFFDALFKGSGIAGILIDGLKGLVGGFLAFKGVQFFQNIITSIAPASIEAAIAMESLERRFLFISNNAQEAANSLAFVRGETARLGTDMKSSMEGYVSLGAATRDTALESQTQKIFSGVSQASTVYDLNSEQQSRVFAAVQQMAGKGKVSAEELRQQLGEVLPGAFNIAARAIGVTTQTLDKMMSQGKLLSEDFLPKFAQQLSAETAMGVKGAANSSVSALINFNNALFQMQATIGKTLLPIKNLLLALGSGAIKFVTENADFLLGVFRALAVMAGVNLFQSFGALTAALMKIPGVASAASAAMGTFQKILGNGDNKLKATQLVDGIGDTLQNIRANPVQSLRSGASNVLSSAKNFGVAMLDNAKGGLSALNGGLLSLQKNGISNIGANFTRGAIGVRAFGKAALINGVAGFIGLASGARALLSALAPMLTMFVVIEVGMKVFEGISAAFKDASGDSRNFADTATESLQKYREALAESRGETEKFKATKLVRDESLLDAMGIGALLPKEIKADANWFDKLRFGTGKAVTGLIESPANLLKKLSGGRVGSTYEDKKLGDNINATSDLSLGVNATTSEALSLLGTKGQGVRELGQLKQYDDQLRQIQTRRAALVAINPQDKAGLKVIDDEQTKILEAREKISKPIGILQSNMQTNVDMLKKEIEKYQKLANEPGRNQAQYKNVLAGLESDLTSAQKAQDKFNRAVGESVNAFSLMQKNIQGVVDKLADAEDKATVAGNTLKSSLYTNSKTQGELQFGLSELDIQQQEAKIKRLLDAQAQTKALLQNKDAQNTLQAYGITENTGRAELKTISEKAGERVNDKYVIDQYAALQERSVEISNLQAGVEQGKYEFNQKLVELNKQIEEYYRSASRQFAESSLEAQRQTSQLKIQSYATDIKTSISGFQDNIVSQFADSVIESIQQLSEAADKQFDVGSAALQANNAFEDSLRQGEELRRQLPGISAKGSIDIPAIPIELDLSKIGIDNKFIDITKAFNNGLLEAKDTIKDSESATNDLTSAFQDVTLGSLDFGDTIQQTVATTEDGIYATQGLGSELLNTTFTASDLGFAIETNTDSINSNNDAVIATNDSLFASLEATGNVTAATINWGTEISNVGGVIENELKVALDSLPLSIQEIIKNTVDWFSTFANNIPILNIIGQIFNSWGQQLESVTQSVVSFRQGAMQTAGNVVQQGIGFVQNALGIGEKPPVGNASQPVFPIAGVTAAQAESRKTSPWGMRRHPVTGQTRMHRGQDYGYGEGTQVVSPMAGVVTGVKYQAGGAGKYVVVESIDEHGRKIEHKFFHLSAYDVVEGQKLNAGDKIGKVGSTGIGTGAHLHYETWINGKNVNPTEFLAGRNGRGLSSAQKGQIEQHHPGDGHNHGGSATQVKQNQSQRQGINASQIASQYGLNSLLVQDVKSGEILGTYNANQAPSSPASTIKLIAADLIHAAIKEGKVSLDQSVTIAKNQVAEGSSIQAGQKVSIRDLMTRMLRDSDNTSFNALVGILGGTEAATAQAQKRGFTGTQIRNYLSIPGATNAFGNTSTPADVTKAMRNLQINQGGAADTARAALGQTRNFGFSGESGGKIGNNSRVTGNVGLANINGRQVIITAYKNQGDSTRNRSQITSASNDVVSQLQGRNTSVSPNIPQRVVNQGGAPKLGKGYEALNELGGQLSQNKYFDPSTAEGRGRLVLALGIGGSEAFEKGTNRRAFYTYKGGTGNNMQGFGQFNNAYHKEIINTPEKYQNFFGQILAGERRLPNSQKGIGDYGSKVIEAVQSGRIKDGADLIRWMQANKLGGSNWQGVDDGWKRNPGLADQLVSYLKGGLPTQQKNTPNNTANVQIPQVANTPVPTVWTPGSIATRGNTAISDVTGRAEQQRDRQVELARQKASNEAAQNTANALRASNKAFLDLERELRQNGIKVSSLSNQVTDTNLEYKGALDNEQKRQQEQRQLETKYTELENSIVEQKRAIESQIGTARVLLSKGGVVSPEMREKVQKLIDDPTIKENLREQLRTALTTGVLGDDGKNILNRAVTEGEDQLKKLTIGLENVRKGREESKKLLDDRFAAEEKARKQQASFDIENASIDTLKAKLDQLQQLKSTAPFSPDVKGIPDLEALISAREEQLNLEKQLKGIQDKEKAKEYTKEEADRLRAEIGERKKILDVTLKQKTENAKLAFLRESEARDREARQELVQAEIANDKVRIEQLKTLAQTNPLSPELANNAIGELEKRVALREAELQLAQELAAIEQAGFEGKRTPEEITKLNAEKQSEYDVKIQNINAQAQQTAFASQISQSKVILSIKEQELQYQKQIVDTTTQAINLGLQQGDPIKLKFEVDKKELEISVEKQILDMKEFANSTGKSQEEIAELELRIRELNNLTLDNLKGEFDKALAQRTETISQRVSGSQVELLETQASFYSNRGMTNKARTLQRDSAILQQQSAYRGQKIELEEFIRTTQVGAIEADKLRQNLEQINQVKLDTVKDNFNAFKPVIDTVQTGLKGFFAGIIKGGQSIEELFNGLMDSILGSVAEIASNYLVEKLFGGLLGGNKNEGQGGMFEQGDSGDTNPLSLLDGGSELGTTPVLPVYVNVVNGNTFGGLNNGTLGSMFGGKEDSTTSFLASTFSGFTGKVDSANPVPVGIIKSAPDALSPITNALGSFFSGKGGFGSIVSGIGSLFSGDGKNSGGGGIGRILASVSGMVGGGGLGGIVGIASSLLGSFFWNGGIVGNYAQGGIIDAIDREKSLNGGRGVAIAALTHGERVLNLAQTQNLDKLGGVDILNFNDGGMVGYVPKTTEYGGSADKVIENASRPKDINVKLETQVINGVEYLTKSQGEDLARKAAQQGAEQGAKYISDRMLNSPSYRATHGI